MRVDDAVPRRRRLEAAERRETILAAATEVFSTVGYQRARVRDIAARVGVSEPVVFQNFATKARLFAAVLDRATDEAVQAATAVVEDADEPGDLLGRLVNVEEIDQVRLRGSRVLFADAFAWQEDPVIHEATRRGVARVNGLLTDIVRRGQEAGTLRDDVPAELAVRLLLSVLCSREFRRLMLGGVDFAEEEQRLYAVTVDLLRSS